MPYYCVPLADAARWKDGASFHDPPTSTPYASKQAAVAYRLAVETIVFVPNALEAQSWQDREAARFDYGTYIRVPWISALTEETVWHYAHLSLHDPSKVAYTPSHEFGIRDRQIRTSPGKYLQQFLPGYSHQHERWIAECVARTSYTLKFATTAKDIERVYRGSDYPRGYDSCDCEDGDCTCESDTVHAPFVSCMGPDGHDGASDICAMDPHPVIAYAGPDLAVAYVGPIDAVLGRCVVWPARKIYTRVYCGTSLLRVLLHQHSYTEGRPLGARLSVHWHGDESILMPYVDGADRGRLSLCGRYVVLWTNGEIDTQTTAGSTYVERPAEDDAEASEDDYRPNAECTCPNCVRYREEQAI
jgi:hypothetical protein